MIHRNDITAIILAGGKSSRMGSDKGLTELNGKSFVKRIIDSVESIADSILIITENSAYDQFNYPRFNDIIPDVGPLGGIHAGLTHSETALNLVLSCDVPMLSSEVITHLIDHYAPDYEVIQLKSDDKTMPLVALYNRSTLSKIERWLEQDKRRVREFVASLKVKTIKIDSYLNKHLVNINTPDQLNKIENVTTD